MCTANMSDISLENVAKFGYLGTRVTNQSYIHKQVKGRVVSGMFATIQFRMSSPFPSKNVSIKMYKKITFYFVWV